MDPLTYALVDGGVCINILMLTPDDEAAFAALLPDDQTVLEISTTPGSPGIGWNYTGSSWTPPSDQLP